MHSIIKKLPIFATVVKRIVRQTRSAAKTSAAVEKCNVLISFKKPTIQVFQRSFYSSKPNGLSQDRIIVEWNTIGAELSAQERWSEALEAFNKVLKTDPTNYRALAGKAAACYMMKDYQTAIECYTQQVDRTVAAEQPRVLLARGLAYCQLGQFDAAFEDIKLARQLDSTNTIKDFWKEFSPVIDQFGPGSAEIYSRALKEFPNDAILYYYLASSLFKIGRHKEAMEPSERAVEMEPNKTNCLMLAGFNALRLGDYKRTLKFIDACIKIGTANHEDVLWRHKTEAEYRLGNYDEMERACYQAFEQIKPKPSKDMLQNALGLVSILQEYKEIDRAIKLLEQVVSFENGEFSMTVQVLVSSYIEAQRFGDMNKLFKKLHDKNPTDPEVKYWYANTLNSEEAVMHLEELARTRPEARVWRDLGHHYNQLGLYQKCLDACDKAIAIEESLKCRDLQVSCYIHLRQYDKENQVMHRICEMRAHEESELCQHSKALPFIIRWQYKRALQIVDEFIGWQPKVCDAWIMRASILKDLGRETEALEAIERAIKIDSHWGCYCQKMDILATFGRFDEAFKVAKYLKSLLSDDFMILKVVYHFCVGVTLQKQGKYEEALKHINISIDNMDHMTEPDIFRFQYWTEKAKVLEALHRDDEAITNYEHALHIFPHEPHSLVQLTKLYLTHGRESEARALAPRLSSLNTDVESFNKQVADLLVQLK